jgi:hypothetical protein
MGAIVCSLISLSETLDEYAKVCFSNLLLSIIWGVEGILCMVESKFMKTKTLTSTMKGQFQSRTVNMGKFGT